MEIRKTNIDGKNILAPEGFIDTENAVKFETEVDAALSESTDLVIDFEKVEYISSSGLRILLKAQKKVSAENGTMIIKNLSDSVKEVFNLTGFLNILTVE